MEATNEIDMSRFIVEIQLRPPIWNYYTKEHADKNIIQACWDDILGILISTTHTNISAADKARLVKQLRYKWQKLRMSYIREFKRLAKDKIDLAKGKSPYYKELSFLNHIVKHRAAANSMGESDDENDDENTANDDENTANDTSWAAAEDSQGTGASSDIIEENIKRENMSTEDVEEIISASIVPSKSNETIETAVYEEMPIENDEDSDRLFLMSLLKPLRQIPHHLRLRVKIQIMQTIERGRLRALGIAPTVTHSVGVRPNESNHWGNFGAKNIY